ncbi:MAG TPA: nitroreductase family protein [Victivallales bacterium]|nr:nitroreductase family protein [Victivallales bacterium]
MGIIKVDQNRCIKDKICSDVCPKNIIEIDDNGYPFIQESNQFECINCGHCASICPTAALMLHEIKPDTCLDIPENWKISSELIETFMKSRRSVRAYKGRSIEKEKLEKLIDIARYAPSGLNLQPVKWKILNDREKLQQIVNLSIDWMKYVIREEFPWAEALAMHKHVDEYEQGKDPILKGAPAIIIAYGDKKESSLEKSSTIALSYLELAAYSFNLGTCWGGYFEAILKFCKPVRDIIGLTRKDQCTGVLMIGYPKYKYKKIPLRKPADITWL